MNDNPQIIEKEANSHLVEQRYNEAFKLFQKAANLYRKQKNHRQSTLCFALAASCWSTKSGEKRFINAALSYEEAAHDAELCSDLEYASLLYKQAAINYERDREFLSLSECLYHSKECYRKFLTYRLLNSKKIHPITKSKEKKGIISSFKRIFSWFMLTFSFLIWGHGERPSRTLSFGILVILLSSLLYSFGYLLKDGTIFRPHFLEALYFSVITFTTVGFGDITALGFSKVVVTIEALCAIFIVPLFIIGFTRKYLRI